MCVDSAEDVRSASVWVSACAGDAQCKLFGKGQAEFGLGRPICLLQHLNYGSVCCTPTSSVDSPLSPHILQPTFSFFFLFALQSSVIYGHLRLIHNYIFICICSQQGELCLTNHRYTYEWGIKYVNNIHSVLLRAITCECCDRQWKTTYGNSDSQPIEKHEAHLGKLSSLLLDKILYNFNIPNGRFIRMDSLTFLPICTSREVYSETWVCTRTAVYFLCIFSAQH